MNTSIATSEGCCKCNNPFVVNKRYKLCDDCNFKRLHNGKSKSEVYQERANQRTPITYTFKPKVKKVKETLTDDIDSLKNYFSIKKISDVAKYKTSTGEVMSQAQVNRKYAETCDRIKATRDPICQGSGRGDVPLSFSHTISRKRCKELGKCELIWDENNIEIEGYHEPSSTPVAAHNIWSEGSWDMKKKLLNFTRKVEYIKIHDPETYRKIQNHL